MSDAHSQGFVFRGQRCGMTVWELETRPVAHPMGPCGSEQGLVWCGLAGVSLAGGVSMLDDVLLAEGGRAL